MKQLVIIFCMAFLFMACKNEVKKENDVNVEKEVASMEDNSKKMELPLDIQPISHATAVLKWDDEVIYTDPVGGAMAFEGKDKPSFILITDIHGDHMDAKTLQALNLGETKIVVPEAVKKQLPKEMDSNSIVLNNGESIDLMGFNIIAIPMYNLPETKDAMHPKGRGNGYIIEKDGYRVYISGDTEDIPEMRALINIDIAVVSMNLPYTMTVEDAADGVLAFAPKKVYPYHYRGKDGLADVAKFKELVNKGNKNIEVVQLDWYPEMK